MKQNNNENAANRCSYVGQVYCVGERAVKEKVLSELPKEWSILHSQGYIHIHDLDAYDATYNCLTFNLLPHFPYDHFEGVSSSRAVIGIFEYLQMLLADMGNEQSGGMAFGNFDNDLATILEKLNVKRNNDIDELIAGCIANLITWCNNTHTRMGQTSYYVSFNIGLADSETARFIAYTLLDEFEKAGSLVYKPNIIFKVCDGINRHDTDPNYDLFKKAMLCTAKKMIPTYLLCDCKSDKNYDPKGLSIMGCRTRVVTDEYGVEGAIGRGNIANISINLPRLALEIDKDMPDATTEEKYDAFVNKWDEIAQTVKDILLHRYHGLCKKTADDFPINQKHQMWCEEFRDLENVFKHGTLSIGFIGLSEALEVIIGSRYYENMNNYITALGFVKHMRDYCDFLKKEYRLNFSLLATSGELISGRFLEIDKQLFAPHVDIFSKGFYTNSFHVNVDSNLSAFKKIEFEGMFHEYCNGGSITYVEIKEAPIGNDEGIQEYIEFAINRGVHYLGFNFPKDVCNTCGATGVFDVCPACGSNDITRIRRVSGYLEVLDGFTQGKKNEVKHRKEN